MTATSASVLDQICRDYQLGELLASCDCLSASHTHQLQRWTTTRGIYAIKKLHPVLANSADYLRRYHHSLQLAEILCDRGFPVNSALKREQQFLYSIPQHNDQKASNQKSFYLVLPWVEGTLLADRDVRAEHVRQIATLLGNIHTISAKTALAMPALNYAPQIKLWEDYRGKQLRIAPTLEPLFVKVWPMLCELSEQVPRYHAQLQQDRVLSHGDLDPHNVLWRSENDFTVIDWEWGGQVNRTQDCWAVALSWSRVGLLQWDLSRFKTFWQAYRDEYRAQDGVDQTPAYFPAFVTLCGYWLEWVDWTIQRVLATQASPSEQQFANRTLTDILETLYYLHHHYSLFESVIDSL